MHKYGRNGNLQNKRRIGARDRLMAQMHAGTKTARVSEAHTPSGDIVSLWDTVPLNDVDRGRINDEFVSLEQRIET